MVKQGRLFLLLMVLVLLGISLTACIGGIWTGANMVYDRHDVYKKLNDYHLMVETTNALFVDKKFKSPGCVTDIAVFNGDVLVVGHVPSFEMLEEAKKRLATVDGYRRIFNFLIVKNLPDNTTQDTWITTKIRSHIFADASIDPNAVKVLTTDRIVYLLGDVNREEAEKVIKIARNVSGVERVVKMLKLLQVVN